MGLVIVAGLLLGQSARPGGAAPGAMGQAAQVISFSRHTVDDAHYGLRKVGGVDGDGYPDLVARVPGSRFTARPWRLSCPALFAAYTGVRSPCGPGASHSKDSG